MKTLTSLIILSLALATPALAERAGSGSPGRNGSDHDRARSAVEREEILPLSKILGGLQKRFRGRVIKLELESDDGHYVYELKLITPEGRIIELEVDAATGLPIGGPEDSERNGDK
ncbi:putative membrane protein YkoI [Thioclava sp. ES.031]|uniref:PepSY domain-containing protein n=1 Tax=Thioclava sp. ES.031 TaxID=1798203 RepID=UPI000BF58E7F|nr:PepSY domain-containing protein [Thioclava sp. ES.031]PFG65122.1 putative membrane protein YkoI [Thioclava sp. ES.031]